ncbi:type II toxin-antitoxin system VapC family toxin [Microbulbifer rhizosphaerae]|uniref:Putative nucleic acid-binding protein n=1 Tax=Microbulbifer rhizosphaerae TaxID=1562603 RepID=A0A7W4WCJ8_9GAMM|nr:type II toxin-antitoxin system VapC family toxin [Microbulbifer rhizosphaerae]MBB3061086.1 putative nucleic acid-binding protein [Microbulbifer rhizosphaerae]
MSTKVLVSDTNIWIDLHHGGLLELVLQLPFEFVTTDFVHHELRQPPGADLVNLGLQVVELSGQEVTGLYALRGKLGNSSLADVSCYYVADKQGWTLLTGDGALRKSGKAANLDVRGTLWLIDQLFERKLLDGRHLAESLQAILDCGARLPDAECETRIEAWAGEN